MGSWNDTLCSGGARGSLIELCGEVSSRGDAGRRSSVLTRASGARDGARALPLFGVGDIADGSGCTGNMRRMFGCLRAVSGFGKGRPADPVLVMLALDVARSLRVVAIGLGRVGAAGAVGHSHDGYGGAGSTSVAPGSSLLGWLVDKYDVMNGTSGRSSWSGSNLE